MNQDSETATLIHELDKLFARWMLFRAWRHAHSCGENKCSLDGFFILEALQLSPGLTTKGLTKVLGKHFSQVMDQLKLLEEKDLINVRRENGTRGAPIYLTESGQEQLIKIRHWHVGGTSDLMVDTFHHDLADLTEEEVARLRSATNLLLVRQEKMMEEEMLGPAPIICLFG